jgi:hypothetical protein
MHFKIPFIILFSITPVFTVLTYKVIIKRQEKAIKDLIIFDLRVDPMDQEHYDKSTN